MFPYVALTRDKTWQPGPYEGGKWEESDVTDNLGALGFAPQGVRPGPHVAGTEVIRLTTFAGPLT